MSSENLKVILSGAPSDCALKKIKQEVANLLNGEHAVKRVIRCKGKNGETIPGKFEIQLVIPEGPSYEYQEASTVEKCSADEDSASDDEFFETSYSGKQRQRVQTWPQFSAMSEEEMELETASDSDDASFSSTPVFKQKRQPKTSKKKTTFDHLVQTDPDIFEISKNRPSAAVLVQFDEGEISSRQVAKYFENHHNWKPWKTFHLEDGYLLVYRHKKTADEMLKRCNSINEVPITTFFKHIPPIFKDRILIKGVSSKEKDFVLNILKSCTEVGCKVKKVQESDMFLAIFDQEIDFNAIKNKLKRLKLQNASPEFLRVCQTDCIKIENLKKDAANDLIKVSFADKSLIKGEVTWVSRCEDDKTIACVFFDNYEDAERLVLKAQTQEIQVAKASVSVSLHWFGIKVSFDQSNNELRNFVYPLKEIDPDVVRFVFYLPQYMDALKNDLSSLADIEIKSNFDASENCLKVKPLKTSKQDDEECDQKDFERKCKSKLDQFFNKIRSTKHTFTPDDKSKVKNAQKWNDEEQIVNLKISDENAVNVFVRWNDGDNDTIKVVGESNDITSFVAWFHETSQQTKRVVKLEQSKFDNLINCGLLDDVTSIVGVTKVEIKHDKRKCEITLIGSRDKVNDVHNTIITNLERLKEQDISFLHPIQQEFLRKSVQTASGRNNSEIISLIQSKFHSQDIKANLQLRGNSLKLVYLEWKRSEFFRAQQNLKDLLKYQTIPAEIGLDEITADQEWKQLQKKIEASGKLLILQDNQASCFSLVGFPVEFDKEFENISAYIADNVEKTETVQMLFSHAAFFAQFSDKIGVENNIHGSVGWHKENESICLRGRLRHVDQAVCWITSVVKDFVSHEEVIALPGMDDYFRSNKGKEFINITAEETTCYISLDSQMASKKEAKHTRKLNVKIGNPNENLQVATVQAGVAKSWTQRILGFLPGSSSDPTEKNVKVTVLKGDILTSKCDVMVNTTAAGFDLRSSILSSKLLMLAGNSINDECQSRPLLQKAGYRITSGGKSQFQFIVHFVPTKVHLVQNLEDVMIYVNDTLQKSSLAIPAIGTGAAKLLPRKAAQLINKAIKNFQSRNPTVLKQIEVVIFEQKMLADFERALSSSNASHSAAPQPASSTQHGGIAVNVSAGDILTSTCEVLINSTGGNFNLTGSQLSAKLVKLAGNDIVRECQVKPIHQSNTYRVTSGGNSQFENIVHLVPTKVDVLAQSLEEIFKIIDAELKCSSAAIPAIGTGAANLSAQKVAEAINLAITNFKASNPTHLTQIDVVVYQQHMLADFQNALSGTASNFAAAPTTSTVVRNGVTINVTGGDILKSDCEVMVNSTGNFDLTGSVLSSKVIQQGGNSIKNDCQNNPLYKSDEFRITDGGSLHFDNIVHFTPPKLDVLSQSLEKVLNVVDVKFQKNSLAIPAIGTGAAHFSPAKVAEAIDQAITNFIATNPSHLKRIDVVIYQLHMIADFENALTQSGPGTSTASQRNSSSFQNGVTVNVSQGDILQSNCDVLINTTGKDFNLTTSQLSAKLIKVGGTTISDECANKPEYSANEYRVTSGGTSSFQKVVHMVTPPRVGFIHQYLEKVLLMIDQKLQKDSVAIPAIGTGSAKKPVPQIAKEINQGIKNFVTRNPQNLTRIEIVIFQPPMLLGFQTNINISEPDKNARSVQSESVQADASAIPKCRLNALEDEVDEKHRIVLYFTSNAKTNNEKALELVMEKVNSKRCFKTLHDDVLEKLDDRDFGDLKDIEKHGVRISIPNDGKNNVEIWGLERNVDKATTEALEVLSKYNKAVHCHTTWMYEDSRTNVLTKLSLLENYELEQLHKENEPNTNEINVTLKNRKTKMTVDFAKKTFTDGNSIYKIVQKDFKKENFPPHWEASKTTQLVPISSLYNASEFTMVLKKFQRAGLHIDSSNVVKMQRVENQRQYTQFICEKKEVQERMKRSGVNLPVTLELFHGTTKESCDVIYKNKFDRGCAGKNATRFGKGVYFSINACYSDQFAVADSDGCKWLFLAEVITGEFTQGDKNMKIAPYLPNSSDTQYDSVVDDMEFPTMHIVFKDTGVYPLYILTYKD